MNISEEGNRVRTTAAALLAAVLLAAGSAAAQGPGGGAPPPMPVEAVPVSTADLNLEIGAVGTLGANESIILRPEIEGRIKDIHFKEGETVEKGTKLVTLDPAEYQAQVDESSAALKLSQISYERAKRLLDQKLASRQEFDQEAAKLAQARARLELDQERLRKTVLSAPFSGVLGLRQVSPGDFVQVGQDMVNLEDVSSLKLDFQVPEMYLRDVKPGLQVKVAVDAFPGEAFSGEVYAISPRLDVASRSVQLRARVKNVDGKLRPGMFARVKLLIATHPDAMLVPEEALWPIGNDQHVYVVADGKVALTKVKIGYRQNGQVEIVEGIRPGDTVVTAGQMKIRDGAPVMVTNAAQSEAAE